MGQFNDYILNSRIQRQSRKNFIAGRSHHHTLQCLLGQIPTFTAKSLLMTAILILFGSCLRYAL
jgi:hypothetical protein